MDRVHHDYSTWAQEVGERFLLTRLSAGKFLCTKGRQSHKYLKGALWSTQRLPFALFSNTDISSAWNLCPDRLSSPTNKIIICVRVMQISRLAHACTLELLSNCTVFELFTLHCERIFTWFTIPTAARWSFLQSLQIPVNSQALSLGNVQWLSHFLKYLSLK